MYGSKKTAPSSQIAPTPSPSPSRAGVGAAKSRGSSFPWVLITAVALYFVWAILEQHEKLKAAIKPQAIGINLRNLALIMVTVVLGLNLFKVLAVKLSVFIGRITGGRFRLQWLVDLAGGA